MGTPLPSTNFSYKPFDAGFSNYSSFNSHGTPAFRHITITNSTTADSYDFNGDGLPDIVDSSTTPWQVTLKTGSGYMAPMDWVGAPAGSITEMDAVGNVTRDLIDINGDGLPDVVIAKTGGTWDAWLNNGNGFAPSISWSVPPSDRFIRTVTEDPGNPGKYIVNGDLLDVNGDGVVDLVSKGAMGWQVACNRSGQAWLLEKITEDLGGTTTITYASSAAYQSTQLPFNYWVISSITRDNGLPPVNPQHTTATTGFSYAQGLYDIPSNEFRGFGRVTETRPDSAIVVHTYHQDDAKKGKEAETVVTDAAGNPYSSTGNTWSATAINGVFTVKLDKVEEFSYDGMTDNAKQVVTEYEYDAYGNVIQEARFGDAALNGDELFTLREYVYNTDLWIVNKVKHVYNAEFKGGPRLRESWFNYDSHTDLDSPPNVGNLTKEEHFLDTGENPVTTYRYDGYGNQIESVDPEGRTIRTDYDDVYHTFPGSVTNAKGQVTVREFNPANGQPKMIRDANGFTTTYGYDVFNRLVKEIRPGDSETLPTTEISYGLDGIPPESVMVKRREVSGTSPTLDSIQFVDGFGRVIQTKSEYQNSSDWITSDVFRDAMGREYKHSNPYLAGNSKDYTLPQAVPSTITDFDITGRPLKTTNPDGKYSTWQYDHWNITGTDENGHAKTRSYDSNQKLRQVVEHNEAESYTTLYDYNSLGELLRTTDTLGNSAFFEYDTLGRKIVSSDPDLGKRSFLYDRTGNTISQNDARGITTRFEYDELNRVKLISYPNDRRVEYLYDQETIGTLSRVTDAVGTVSYGYDARLRKVREDRIMDGRTWTTSWLYDPLDRVASQIYPDGKPVTFSYNGMGRPSAISGILTGIDYNPAGQETLRTYGNGLATSFDYYPDNQRLKKIVTAGKQDFFYEYDNTGNVKKIVNAADGANVRTETFSYDDLDRLWTAGDAGANGYSNSYVYNAIGNMKSETNVRNGATTTAEYTYGLGGAGPHAVTGKSDTKPIIGIFSLNNGKPHATSQQVTLNNIAFGYPTEYMASEDQNFTNAVWHPYAVAPLFTLSTAYGKKTVYFKVRKGGAESTYKINEIEFLPDGDDDGIPNQYDDDNDNDGLPDWWEAKYGIDQSVPGHAMLDHDSDGLTTLQEYQFKTDPTKHDTDGDGWNDQSEINVHKTDPANADMDGDGLSDASDPFPTYPYHDGYSENYSVKIGKFTQGGSMRGSDAYAIRDSLGSAAGLTGLLDTDGDGIPDIFDTDDDNDGIPDDWEIANGMNPLDPTDAQKDFDGDGLTNLQEFKNSTNPGKADSDNDGLNDYKEIFVTHTFANRANLSQSTDTDDDGLDDSVDPYPTNPLHHAVSESYTIRKGNFNSGGSLRSAQTFALSDNIGNPLSGINLARSSGVAVTPAAFDFGQFTGANAPIHASVTNLGTGNVKIGTIARTGENRYEFEIQGDSCTGQILTSGTSCVFNIYFQASFTGAKSAVIQIPTDDLNSPYADITVSGIAMTMADSLPPSGSLVINNGALLTNAHAVELTLSAMDASGVSHMCVSNSNVCENWEAFAIRKPWVLAEGDGVKSVYVWYRDNLGNADFMPFSQAINLDTAKPIATASPKGGVYADTQTVTLASNESGLVYFTKDGRNPNTASQVYSGAITIGSTTAIKFYAVDPAGNLGDIKTEVFLIGTPVPADTLPNITASPSALTFNNAIVGQTALQSITITNTGSATLSISSINISGADQTEFRKAEDNCNGKSVAAGATCTVKVEIVPSTPGAKNAVVAISSNATNASILNISLSGTANLSTKSGDYDGNGVVSISEVQSAINMYLGMKEIAGCVDVDNSGSVSISEVQKAINAFLGL